MRLRKNKFLLILLIGISIVQLTCTKPEPALVLPLKLKRCVFILIDGPRWEETGGDTLAQYTPCMNSTLRPEGMFFQNFSNQGESFTIPGITALLTGHYQSIPNDGSVLPEYPSLMQLYKEKYPASTVWMICSKDKVEVLKDCLEPTYATLYPANTDCGVSGLGSGYREDSVTFVNAMNILQTQHPDFVFIHFKDPDYYGHAADWNGYLNGIVNADKYSAQLWEFLSGDPFYKDQTLFVVTNDHGRHPNGTADGFISHGDGCAGCRHINLFMAGPGIQKGAVNLSNYDQVDIHKTITTVFGLNDAFSEGQFMTTVFQ